MLMIFNRMLTSRYTWASRGYRKKSKRYNFKNVIIPVRIEYDLNKDNHKPPNTVIFKNRWYNHQLYLLNLLIMTKIS